MTIRRDSGLDWFTGGWDGGAVGDAGGQVAALGQLRPMGPDPVERRRVHRLGLGHAFGEHTDRPVGTGESRLGAHRLQLGVTDLALGAAEKAPCRLP